MGIYRPERALRTSVLAQRNAFRVSPTSPDIPAISSAPAPVFVDDEAPDLPQLHGLSHLHIIDDETDTRTRIHALLSQRPSSIIRTYQGPNAFDSAFAELEGGCIVLVVRSPSSQAAAFLRTLRREARFRAVVLAVHSDFQLAIDVMKAGAVDFLLLDPAMERPEAKLLPSIDEALGQVRQAQAMNDALERARARLERLTVREREVLMGLVAGKSNKMIAQELAISPRTIEIYRAHLMEKLGTNTLSETLRIAFAAGLG